MDRRTQETPGPGASQAGKGTLGCMFSLALLGVAVFALSKAGPPYIAYKSFETEARTEISRAGANFMDDDRIVKNMIEAARRNDVIIRRENVRVERFGNQVQVRIEWVVPMDFVVYKQDVNFKVQAQSLVGRL